MVSLTFASWNQICEWFKPLEALVQRAVVEVLNVRLLGVGLVVGLLASVGVTRVIASQLWGVSPYDPSTLIGVVGVLVMAGLAACYVPARKATVVDPSRALKRE